MAESKDYGQKNKDESNEQNPNRGDTSNRSQSGSTHHGLGSLDEDLQQNVASGRQGQSSLRQDQTNVEGETSRKGSQSSRFIDDEETEKDANLGGNRESTPGNQSNSDKTSKRSGQRDT